MSLSKLGQALAADTATVQIEQTPMPVQESKPKATIKQSGDGWTKQEIATRLQSDDAWLRRGILAIYSRQTDLEKGAQSTKEHNNCGFSGVDAKFLSSIAQQIQRGRTLSPKQITVARKKMHKYAQQLADIANGVR